MRTDVPHITLCICTFKRAHLLNRLLQELGRQKTGSVFEYSITIVDNDVSQSAREVVAQFQKTSPLSVTYCVEPSQNIALARNRAVANSHGDFVAFIDDDELPPQDWLLILFDACSRYEVDGVLGPVKPYFEQEPPSWIIKGGFYDRATYETGFVIDWRKGRTGNVLLKRKMFLDLEEAFNPAFITGEDQDFFRRMIEKGYVFVWCNEAVAYEVVPPVRWKRSFMLRRALLRGKIQLKNPSFGFQDAAKSVIAVMAYLAALPFLFLLGQHLFMNYLIKIFDHGGRLLALLGLNRIAESYISE